MPGFLPFLLLAVPGIAAVICMLPAPPLLAERASAVAALALLGLGIWLVAATGAKPAGAGPWLYVDALSAVLILVITAVGSVALLYSLGYARREVALGRFGIDQIRWYYLWLHLFILCM